MRVVATLLLMTLTVIGCARGERQEGTVSSPQEGAQPGHSQGSPDDPPAPAAAPIVQADPAAAAPAAPSSSGGQGLFGDPPVPAKSGDDDGRDIPIVRELLEKGESIDWRPGLAEAMAESEATGKPVLIVFSARFMGQAKSQFF